MKWTWQEPNTNPNATTIACSATGGLVYSLLTEPSGPASGRVKLGRGTSGRCTSRRGPSERGTLGRRTLERLSPPADSISSCRFTSSSELFPAAPASPKVSTAGLGLCDVTSPKCCSPLRGWVSGVRGRGWGSGVCGHGVSSGISRPNSGSRIGW